MSMLPGMTGPAALQRPSLISLFATAIATSGATITAPASILAGDLIVLVDRAEQATTALPALVTPAGFTSLGNVSLTDVRMNTSYKLAAGTEGGTVITGMNGTFNNAKAMAVFRRQGKVFASVIPSAWGGQATDGDPTPQAVASGAAGALPRIVLGSYGVATGGSVVTRTMTPPKDAEVGAGIVAFLAWKFYEYTPQDTTIDTADNGNRNTLQSGYVTLT
jgi:hypothetical protein